VSFPDDEDCTAHHDERVMLARFPLRANPCLAAAVKVATILWATTVLLVICSGSSVSLAAAPYELYPSRVTVARARTVPRLVSYRVGEHARFDRVVFVFSGGLPGWRARYVKRVRQDATGFPVRLEGKAFLHITLMGLDWSVKHTPAEPTLTPRMAVLRQLKPAGVFEGYFSFGLGLSYRATYRFFVLRNPVRLVLDLDRHRGAAGSPRAQPAAAMSRRMPPTVTGGPRSGRAVF
jgi:hypothetical protein